MPTPVVLFTYKRPDHTRATLTALALNKLANQTDLFVFSDGPKLEADAYAVSEVRKVVRAATGFASVTLIERPINMGLARSVITGVTELFERYDRIIVLEDDLVTSQHFLEYMNDSLEFYRDDAKAFSVTGHTFPASHLNIPSDYTYDTYSGYRCSSWSWGTWRDRWQRIDWEMGYFPDFYQDLVAREAFNRGGQDMSELLRLQYEGKINSWAIRFCYAHHVNDMRCIYPIKTLVRNIGLDNSGTHSKPDPRFTHAKLDEDWYPQRLCAASETDSRILDAFRGVFDPPKTSGIYSLIRKAIHFVRPSVNRVRGIFSRAKNIFFPKIKELDLLIVNTYQNNGGAARAAWRTYCGVKKTYPSSVYLTLFKEESSSEVIGLMNTSVRGAIAQWLIRLDQLPLRAYRNRLQTFFSTATYPNPLRIPLLKFSPKLAHLHWVGHSMLSVEEIGSLKCPVIWTLHDTWAFTGGCHYTGSCIGYRKQCGKCPQLMSDDENDISHSLMKRKAREFQDLNLTIVTPSNWMADLAASSSLFAGRRIKVIPNGLDTEAFKPIGRSEARAYLSLSENEPVILFGAHWIPDPRKGGDLLCKAIAQLGISCTLVTFGEGHLQLPNLPNVKYLSLGSLNDPSSLALAYSAADVFVCPSREDNLPNTVAESMACGTPCVAFDVNGLPDMITHCVDGWLAKPFDPNDMAAGIRWIITHPNPEALHLAARQKALAEYSLDVMSARYTALYAELLE